jgi:DNA replication licensing factor MCM3
MEQGRVTIAKAGIHAKLNARCSVLAAANPVYGRYDQYKTPMENIGLQDSLLSRFDLLFIVLDMNDPDNDRMISDHILSMHRYRSSAEQDGEALALTNSLDLLSTTSSLDANEDETETPVYDKYDPLLHRGRSRRERIVSVKFMRKYIHVAKDLKPVLTRQAADYIADEYSKLRNQDNLQHENISRTQPVTARSLETLIRLATAHAKCRLSKTVDVQDAQSAIELVQYAYFKKVLKKERRRKRSGDVEDEEVDENNDTELELEPERKRSRQRGDDPYEYDDEGVDIGTVPDTTSLKSSHRKSTDKSAPISAERLKLFKTSLFNLFKSEHKQSLTFDQVETQVNRDNVDDVFTRQELMSAIDQMQDDNQIMLSDNILFLI